MNDWRRLLEDIIATSLKDEELLDVGRHTENREVKAFALLLFNRSLSNARAFLLLLDNNLPLEAGTIARSCIENAIWLGALNASPTETLYKFEMDAVHNQKSRIDNMFSIIGVPKNPLPDENPESFLSHLREARNKIMDKERSRAKLEELIQTKETDELYYIHYKELSDRMAHISNNSMLMQADIISAKRGLSNHQIPDRITRMQMFTAVIEALLVSRYAILGLYNIETDETYHRRLKDLLGSPIGKFED